jgi:hypothetical protein
MLVSVLDLEQYRSRGQTPDSATLGKTSDTDVVSLYTMSIFLPHPLAGTAASVRLDDQTLNARA